MTATTATGCGPSCWDGVGTLKGEPVDVVLHDGLPLKCQLCPDSPTYWRQPIDERIYSASAQDIPESMGSELVDAAVRYAAFGWPVLPVWWTPSPGVCACPDGATERNAKGDRHSKGKHPITDNGVSGATTNAATITAWWTRWPQANIGIATGAPGPDVVDVDVHEGKPGLASRDRLKSAGLLSGVVAIVTTGSGGQHLYFVGTDQGNGAIRTAGVDFRSKGGYVLAPPSVVNGGAYVAGIRRPVTEGRTVDWSAIKAFFAPPRKAPAAVHERVLVDTTSPLAQWCAGELQRVLDGGAPRCADTSRSGVFHELVGLAMKAGMTETQTVLALTPWCESTGKFAGRVDHEVARSWARKARVS